MEKTKVLKFFREKIEKIKREELFFSTWRKT